MLREARLWRCCCCRSPPSNPPSTSTAASCLTVSECPPPKDSGGRKRPPDLCPNGRLALETGPKPNRFNLPAARPTARHQRGHETRCPPQPAPLRLPAHLPAPPAYSPARRRFFAPLSAPQKIHNGPTLLQSPPALLANLLLEHCNLNEEENLQARDKLNYSYEYNCCVPNHNMGHRL